ncbi:PAS domain-containing sensor histidine kinase [Marinospirillum perlucidum]|uniref:sensor histidine kinase n=1 Tax=Marinospirillum perlucidum TaxID=1982602 RepID=UPI00138FCD59|nr:PAS domain-containing sensor histidine kinase [Marinospirillum perlucidum]
MKKAQKQGQELASRLAIANHDDLQESEPSVLLKQLVATEIKMRDLLLSHPAPLMVVDQDTCLLLTNAAARQLFYASGITREQLQRQGACLADFLPALVADQELFVKVDKTYHPGGEAVFLVKETPIQWQHQPARVLLLHDVSLEIEARRKLEEAVSSLEEVNRMKSEFMSMASHELRTPLASVYSSLQLMESYCEKLEATVNSPWLDKLNDHIRLMENTVEGLEGLVKEMLVLEKSQAGRIQFKPGSVNLSRLIDEVLGSLAPLAEKLDISLVFSCQPPLKNKVFNLDVYLVQHILTNLVSNAIRFSDAGEKVFINLGCEQDYLYLEVKDQGCGIPEDEICYLGESFYRASNVADVPGTGLGLSIVKHFVDLHGGALNIQTRLDIGSCFRISLPWAQVMEEQANG